MPRFDGTGPLGQGAMTGRGFGPCGRGGRGRFISPKNELTALEAEQKMLEAELVTVREEITALKSK